MRIAKVTCHRLRPETLKEGYDADGNWPADIPCYLVRVVTECDRVGVGEATSQRWYLTETAAQIESVIALYDDALRGADPEAIAVCHQLMESVYGHGMPGGRAARCGVDIALHDLVAKARGVPVHILLGGARRERLELLTNLYFTSPPSMADACRDFVLKGFAGLKVKVGEGLFHGRWSRRRLEQELEKLEATMAVVPPDVMVDADANQAWISPQWTVSVLRRFGDHSNLSIEQPLPYEDLRGAAFVRAHSGVPVILDESVRSPQAAMAIVRAEAADRVVIKINRVGGLYPASQIATICEAAGVGVSVDTSPFTLVGDTASTHLASTITHAYPVDCEGHVSFLSLPEGVIDGGVQIVQGEAIVPQDPGLGVRVAWERVESADRT